jgi:hypothetical protein
MGWRRASRVSAARWRRWADELDPWSPRASDYMVAVAALLLLCLLYVGERNYAVQLNRRLFRLQERAATLEASTEILATRATELAGRVRITRLTRDYGMVVPPAEAVRYIYYVPEHRAQPDDVTARPRAAGVVGLLPHSPEAW